MDKRPGKAFNALEHIFGSITMVCVVFRYKRYDNKNKILRGLAYNCLKLGLRAMN